jgi:hypothetical protein
MPRVTVDKNYFRFNQGKITEASPLSFPENSMKDELNIDINFDGTIQRRRGIDYEPGYEVRDGYFSKETSLNLPGGTLAQVYLWENVANYPKDTPILVTRYGRTFRFFEAYEEPVSESDATSVVIMSGADAGGEHISFAEVKGYLMVCGPTTDPFYFWYDESDGNFKTKTITIQVRDLEGLDSGIEDHIRPTTLSGIHRYNLLNQGWPFTDKGTVNVPGGSRFANYSDSPAAFRGAMSRVGGMPAKYPSNADIYHAYSVDGDGKGGFVESWVKTFALPTAHAPRGKVVINAFAENRKDLAAEYSMKSGPVTPWISPSFVEKSTAMRPTCVAFYQGHVVYSGVNDAGYNDKIYISQSLTDIDRAGRCYSVNDPTDSIESSPLDTDGGVISIEGVDTIVGLVSLGSHLVVIANNGTWSISGSDGRFTMNSVILNKLSSVGGISSSSITEYEGSAFFWSHSGIYMISVDRQFETLSVANITEETIQRDYIAIPDTKKSLVSPIVDTLNRRVYWFYNNDRDDEVSCRMNRALVLDARTGAFFDYEFDTSDNSYPFIVAGFVKPAVGVRVLVDDVVVNGVEVTVDGDQVTISSSLTVSVGMGSTIKFLTFIDQGSSYGMTFSEMNNRNFIDWQEATGGLNYTSFVETGYELMDDSMRDMQTTYVFCYFNRTETEYVEDEGSLAFNYPSSCFLQGRWDWTGSGSAHRWSEAQQVYRFRREFFPAGPNQPFDYDFDVVETKNKVRGKGKSLSLRFSSQEGKDFQLLGWAVRYTAEQTP